MAKRKFVVGLEARQLLQAAADKHMFATVTAKSGARWQVQKSSFLALRSNRLWLSIPAHQPGETPMELTSGQQVAITFKRGYYKCIFATRLIAREQFELEAGGPIPAMIVAQPEQIEKIQRRAYDRVEVPADQEIEVTMQLTETPESASSQVWHGILYNLSAGGMAVRIDPDQAAQLQQETQYRLEFVPLPDQEPLTLDAQLRHMTSESPEFQCDLGFQMVGLEADETGRNALRRIGRIINVYRRQHTACLANR